MENDIQTVDNDAPSNKAFVIPVMEERVVIEKAVIETGRIRIHKQVSNTEETVGISLSHDEHIIEHIPQNIYVETVPVMRQEGNTTIIPVLKEVFVKRILLVEEIRITKHTVQTNEQQNVTLQKEMVTVERIQ